MSNFLLEIMYKQVLSGIGVAKGLPRTVALGHILSGCPDFKMAKSKTTKKKKKSKIRNIEPVLGPVLVTDQYGTIPTVLDPVSDP